MSLYKIQRIEKLNQDTFLFRIDSPEIASKAKAGQFVNVLCGDGLNAYLRRPISICRTDRVNLTFDIVFQIRGKGTRLLAEFKEGQELDVLGPLGNSFALNPAHENLIVMGGGIGIFPLLQLLKDHPAKRKTAVLGFRNKASVVLEKDFSEACQSLLIATDDGSYGYKGFAPELFGDSLKKDRPDFAAMCGPLVMMKKGVGQCEHFAIESQVSMEQRMGCGIGACLVCACKTRDKNDWTYSHVCKDGPIFNGKDILFD